MLWIGCCTRGTVPDMTTKTLKTQFMFKPQPTEVWLEFMIQMESSWLPPKNTNIRILHRHKQNTNAYNLRFQKSRRGGIKTPVKSPVSLIRVPECLGPIADSSFLPEQTLGASSDDLSNWVPSTYVENLNWVPGTQLQTVAGIWRGITNRWVLSPLSPPGESVCVCVCVYAYASQINK